MQTGVIKEIFISSNGQRANDKPERTPMNPVGQVTAVAEMGLAGDRYYATTTLGSYSGTKRIPDSWRQATFIAQEAIDAANIELAEPISGINTRRNVVTEGIDWRGMIGMTFLVLNQLKGSEFAKFKVVEECKPCDIPDNGKLGFKQAFSKEWRGGVRVQVMQTGIIAVGFRVMMLE